MRYVTYAGVTGRGSAHDHNEDVVLAQRQVHIGEAQFKGARRGRWNGVTFAPVVRHWIVLTGFKGGVAGVFESC